MIFTLGKYRKGVHVVHFGQDEHTENIVCGTWRAFNMRWTDNKRAVTCKACRSVLNVKRSFAAGERLPTKESK